MAWPELFLLLRNDDLGVDFARWYATGPGPRGRSDHVRCV